MRAPPVSFVCDSEAWGGAEVYLTIDKDKASRLGLDLKTIDAILYDGFGQRQVVRDGEGTSRSKRCSCRSPAGKSMVVASALSVTRTVIQFVPAALPGGVQANWPEAASMVAPFGAPGSRL